MPVPIQSSFADRLIAWQKTAGRHDLPWQNTTDPYRVWLSEIMLQQTQVVTAIPYYLRFLDAFPNVVALADAPLDRVLELWSGLGYYSRARNLHRSAGIVRDEFAGRFPESQTVLQTLPGVGRSTAAAIVVFCFGAIAAILDGNVKRVLARHRGIGGWPGLPAIERQLWQVAEVRLPQQNVAVYTQGLMDLGSLICTRSQPQCSRCPVSADCQAFLTDQAATLPAKRPAKTTPTRHIHLLVLRQDDTIYCERRPPTGIWGGLLSLPEFSEPPSPQSILAQLGLGCEPPQETQTIKHAFTHFKLIATVWESTIQHAHRLHDAPGSEWLPLSTVKEAALPAPIKKLLDTPR